MATKQNKQFQRRRHLKTKWWPSWISNWQSLSYFQSRNLVATVSFNSDRPTLWEKSKIGFQDCSYGGHFEFPIGMILAIFHLHIYLLLHCKFQLKWPCGLRENVQNRFSRWWLWSHLGFPIDRILGHFDPEVVLLLQSNFQLTSTKELGRDVKKWFSRWWLWWPSWFWSAQF